MHEFESSLCYALNDDRFQGYKNHVGVLVQKLSEFYLFYCSSSSPLHQPNLGSVIKCYISGLDIFTYSQKLVYNHLFDLVVKGHLVSNLFEEVGGETTINFTVEVFFEKVLDDAYIRYFFNKIDISTNLKRQKSFLRKILGGPHTSNSKDMRQMHEHLVKVSRY